jgi:hypothetical protein
MIEIVDTKTVGTLKDRVKDKKKQSFQHIDADNLALWKVSYPVDGGLNGILRKLEFIDEESLSLVDRLSKVFSIVPKEAHLHIVVKAPPTGEYEWLAVTTILMHTILFAPFLPLLHLEIWP